MPLSDSQIESLKLKTNNAPLVAIEAADGTTLVFQRPTRQQYNAWFDTRDEKGSGAALALASQTLVDPPYDALVRVLDAQPALLMCKNGIIDGITSLAGYEGTPAPKKL